MMGRRIIDLELTDTKIYHSFFRLTTTNTTQNSRQFVPQMIPQGSRKEEGKKWPAELVSTPPAAVRISVFSIWKKKLFFEKQ
jgi:hypothetical protein